MKLTSGAVALSMFVAAAPLTAFGQVVGAVPPGFDAVFSGALVSTYGDGRQAKAWLFPNGDFTGQSRAGGRNAGKWTLDRGRVCMRQSRPIPLPFHYCTALPASLNEPWSAKAPTGDRITIRFVAGDRP